MFTDETTMAERAYVRGLLELQQDSPERARDAVALLRADDFSDEDCRLVYRLVCDVVATIDAPDTADVVRHPLWGHCKDLYADLLKESIENRYGFRSGVERHARHVREASVKRRVRDAVDDLKAITADRGASSAQLIQAADAVKAAAADVLSGDMPTTLADAVAEYLANEQTPKVATGFSPFDSMTGGGLPIGGLSVLAAPPSTGKSALALQLALGAIECDGAINVVWALGEMTMEALARRAVCHWSTRRSGRKVSMSVAEARGDAAKGTAIALGDMIGRRMTLVRPPLEVGRIEDAVVETKANLLVIDYLQLVELEAADRRSEVDGIVKRFRRLALEQDVAILAVSNIAKGVTADTRIGAIGKESSELDFAADLLLLGDPAPEKAEDGSRLVRWMCKKNRHGQCEDILTKFDGGLQTFYDANATPVAAFNDWE